MNADLTVSSLSFKSQFSDKTGSLRREISRGVNLPETMQIKHQTYKDSATGRTGNQSAMIFEFYKETSDGVILPVARATLKVQSLVDPAVSTTEIQAVLARVRHVIDTVANGGLDLGVAIYDNKEQ